jgi:HSP20 family molecular chaperone IbpA
MLVRNLSINQESEGRFKTVQLELLASRLEDSRILEKIMSGSVREISISPYIKPKETWDMEAKSIAMNPCAETEINYASGHVLDTSKYFYTGKISPRQFKQEYKAEFMETNTTPHTLRANNNKVNNLITVHGSQMTGTLKVEDEIATLRVELPGILPDDVEIKQIDNMLRIRVLSESNDKRDPDTLTPSNRQLYLILADEETVDLVDLELGLLTITIDRNRYIETFGV